MQKQSKIPVGPGRGSAAGSIVSYSLGITDIDPLKHNLLFERFLNLSACRILILIFASKRGEERLSIISKINMARIRNANYYIWKMKAKQVVRDVGRVMGYSFNEVDKIAKAIPNELNITLIKR